VIFVSLEIEDVLYYIVLSLFTYLINLEVLPVFTLLPILLNHLGKHCSYTYTK